MQQEFFWLLIHGLDSSGNIGAWMSSKQTIRFAGENMA
ncbi:ck1 ck1 ck1-d protein kinase, partial [Nannochloropsis oceanica]